MDYKEELKRINIHNKEYEKQRRKEIAKTLKWAEQVFKEFKRA